MDTRPIGVFDSGLGGLTALRELAALLPGEDLLYFGDTRWASMLLWYACTPCWP